MPASAREENVCLVTGAAGFAGSALVRHLLAEGRRVRALVRNPAQIPALPDGAEPGVADVRDPESLRAAMRGVSEVFHIAALFRQAGLPDADFQAVNVDGVRHVFEAALAAGARRVVHCSTVGVLGDVGDEPADETAPYNPGDIYQRTKMEGEQVALDYFRSGRIPGVVVRPAMVYGPGDTRTLKLFRMIAQGRFFYVGRGQTLMHFIDVRDLALAFDLAMRHHERSGEVYIAAGREPVRLCDLANFCADYLRVRRPSLRLPVKPMQWLGSLCEAVCTPLRLNPPIFRRRVDFFTKNRCFDPGKARRELGFSVNTPFQQEAIEIMDWYWRHGLLGGRIRAPGEACMLRGLDGAIAGWNLASNTRYGYDRAAALGAVSHSLLKTEFPEPLDRINQRLRDERHWEGRLRHTTCQGKQVEVESQWLLLPDPVAQAQVIEINRDPVGDPAGEKKPGVLGLLAGLPEYGEVAAMLAGR